jgi:hypothetical protein
VTRKELIEKGYIDQYVLGLTNDVENNEVERLANLYPEIQQKINEARHKICSSFNRNLTQPAIRNSLLTKRKVMLWAGMIVSLFSIGFCFLAREHFSLQQNYTMQCEELARQQAKVTQLASISKMVNEQSDFIQSPETQRIKLKGGEEFPEAEVMVFHDNKTGKMMLRVIDLPALPNGHYYEVWARQPENESVMLGRVTPPVRFDSLYNLSPLLQYETLEITSVDPLTMNSLQVCAATL